MFQPKWNGLIWLWRKLRVPIFTNGPAQLVSISVKPCQTFHIFGSMILSMANWWFPRWIPSKKFHTKPDHGHLQKEHVMGKWFEKEWNTTIFGSLNIHKCKLSWFEQKAKSRKILTGILCLKLQCRWRIKAACSMEPLSFREKFPLPSLIEVGKSGYPSCTHIMGTRWYKLVGVYSDAY